MPVLLLSAPSVDQYGKVDDVLPLAVCSFSQKEIMPLMPFADEILPVRHALRTIGVGSISALKMIVMPCPAISICGCVVNLIMLIGLLANWENAI